MILNLMYSIVLNLMVFFTIEVSSFYKLMMHAEIIRTLRSQLEWFWGSRNKSYSTKNKDNNNNNNWTIKTIQ